MDKEEEVEEVVTGDGGRRKMQPAQARRCEPGPPPLKAHPLALGGATAGEQRF
jgi:hypothetical protein